MSLQVRQSVKDIVPTLPDPIPPQLMSRIESLYTMSLQKLPVLPNKSEIARYHICTYFAAEHLRSSLDLPAPSQDKIPIAPRHLRRVLDDFRENVIGMERESPRGSPRGSPKGTPRGSPHTTPKKTAMSPSKSVNSPRVPSPLKRLQQLQDTDSTTTPKKSKSNGFKDVESPFNPKRSSSAATTLPPPAEGGSGPSSPAPTTAPSTPQKSKRIVTIPELIAFANHFFVPATVTPHLIISFGNLRNKFNKKNEWLLVCGMIHTVYTRINHQLLAKTIGSKSQFEDQIFQYQKGGLMKWNMLIWCTIVADMLKNEIWLIELERNYSSNRSHFLNLLQQEKEDRFKLGEEYHLQTFGAMIDASVMFNSKSQVDYHDTWIKKVMETVQSQSEGK